MPPFYNLCPCLGPPKKDSRHTPALTCFFHLAFLHFNSQPEPFRALVELFRLSGLFWWIHSANPNPSPTWILNPPGPAFSIQLSLFSPAKQWIEHQLYCFLTASKSEHDMTQSSRLWYSWLRLIRLHRKQICYLSNSSSDEEQHKIRSSRKRKRVM